MTIIMKGLSRSLIDIIYKYIQIHLFIHLTFSVPPAKKFKTLYNWRDEVFNRRPIYTKNKKKRVSSTFYRPNTNINKSHTSKKKTVSTTHHTTFPRFIVNERTNEVTVFGSCIRVEKQKKSHSKFLCTSKVMSEPNRSMR